LQNETNGAKDFVKAAKARGMKLAYSAAPFEAEIAAELLPDTDLLVVNEGEAQALGEMLGRPPQEAGVPHLVITLGGKGAEYHGGGEIHRQPAHDVDVIDTTGAGDCFYGYLLAGMAEGGDIKTALANAGAAAALQVSRKGTAAVIPTRSEVDAFLASPPSRS